jgi:hypothetical protein
MAISAEMQLIAAGIKSEAYASQRRSSRRKSLDGPKVGLIGVATRGMVDANGRPKLSTFRGA